MSTTATRAAVIVGGPHVSDQDVSGALGVGSERTFDQDPALALRRLADIALRALSPAINDPTTAVQSLDVIADLLRSLIHRDLGVVVVDGADRTLRVVVRLHTWEDFVGVALDEIINMHPQFRAGARSPDAAAGRSDGARPDPTPRGGRAAAYDYDGAR